MGRREVAVGDSGSQLPVGNRRRVTLWPCGAAHQTAVPDRRPPAISLSCMMFGSTPRRYRMSDSEGSGGKRRPAQFGGSGSRASGYWRWWCRNHRPTFKLDKRA